jgi:hypothetical protein
MACLPVYMLEGLSYTAKWQKRIEKKAEEKKIEKKNYGKQ